MAVIDGVSPPKGGGGRAGLASYKSATGNNYRYKSAIRETLNII